MSDLISLFSPFSLLTQRILLDFHEYFKCLIQFHYLKIKLFKSNDIKGGGGGGGGGNGYFFVKLDFEIAVDQQTRTSDRTFEGVPDPNRQTVPAGQPRPYLVQIRPNLAKYPEHAQNPYFMCSTCS